MTALPQWLAGRRALVAGAGPAADAVAAGFSSAGASVDRSTAALVDAPEIAEAFAAAEATLGGAVDLLVHAGTELADTAPEAIGLDAWRAGFSADIDGRFLHAAEFTRRAMAAGVRGAILFLMPSPAVAAGRSAAVTAHGALDNLVKSLAVEWSRDGIRVNAIASRAVDGYASATPAVRASLVHLGAYLVSDYGAYVTGTVMGVDEG